MLDPDLSVNLHLYPSHSFWR